VTREISRQTFLRGTAGAFAAGALFGAVRAGAEPVASGWEGLSRAIGGQVIEPNAPQFDSAKAVFNTNYNGMTPAAVVAVTSTGDVQKAMTFAAANNLKVAPRGGGHSYVGASTANGTMVLDLRQLPGGIYRTFTPVKYRGRNVGNCARGRACDDRAERRTGRLRPGCGCRSAIRNRAAAARRPHARPPPVR